MDYRVMELVAKYKDTWRDKPESFWFQRLVGEVGELGMYLGGDLEELPDWKLAKIAATCLNWLDMREGE